MARAGRKRQKGKISSQFASRLAQLPSGARIRAVVLLKAPAGRQVAGRRVERAAELARVRTSATGSLADIDAILGQFGGRRLRDGPDALGSLPVEVTVDGLAALARSERVMAILEDQPAGLIP